MNGTLVGFGGIGLLVVSFGLAGCDLLECAPDSAESCSCGGDSQGFRICDPDGMGWSDCECIDSVDLLFIIDNGNSMEGEQRVLREQIGSLIDELRRPEPIDRVLPPSVEDIHIGVISTDMGSGGFPAMGCDDPDGGELQSSGGVEREGEGTMNSSRRTSCLYVLSAMILLLGGVVVSASCGGGTQFMQIAPNTGLEAPSGKALLVFIGPTRMESGPKNMLWLSDARGRYLGLMEHGTWHAVELDPGEHMIFGWFAQRPRITRARGASEAGGTLQVTAAAGRTYFVRVTVAPNMGFVPNAVLIPLTPSSEDWDERNDWLSRRERMAPSYDAGQAFFQSPENADLVAQRISRLMDIRRHLSSEVQALHTIGQEDGL